MQSFSFRICVATILLLSITPWFLLAQSPENAPLKPFAEYPKNVSPYLKRLHARPEPLALTAEDSQNHKAWQAQVRMKLKDLLGLPQIADDAGEYRARVQLGTPIAAQGYTRTLGSIETEPNVRIPFWLLRPLGMPGKRPLVICSHGHDANGWNTYAGVYENEKHRKATLAKEGDPAVQAVRRGYIALVPATRGLARAVSTPDLKGRHGNRPCRAQLIHCLLAGRTAVGERVWDIQRLLDWAATDLPEVDAAKIVMLGNSGGGVLTVYVAALDERIRVAVPSCSFTSYTSSTGFIFHCDCCLIPRAQSELGDMADVGSLTAPRAMLAVHGRTDSLHNRPDVEAAMARVQRVYKAVGAENRFQHQWGEAGHKFYPELMWPFIENALRTPTTR